MQDSKRVYPGQSLYAAANNSECSGGINCQMSCRDILIQSISSLSNLYGTTESCALILSGGVDTSAIMEALKFAEGKLSVTTAITVLSSAATDRQYANAVAKKFGLEHHIIELPLVDMLKILPYCIEVLSTFDNMELRNSLVVAMALQKAKELGFKIVITGDGADELLGGYSFTWNSEMPQWKVKRDDMIKSMTFSTPVLAGHLNIIADSPYLTEQFIRWAECTSKADCIAVRLIENTYGGEFIEQMTGKICLRDAFPESPAAYRRKDPIEVGSGSCELRTTNFFQQYLNISDEAFKVEVDRIWLEDKIRIRDCEHYYYYTVFKTIFPEGLKNRDRFSSSGNICTSCGYELQSEITLFCDVCGAYPAIVR